MANTLPLIPLETGWQCEYFEVEPNLYEFSDGALKVPYLSDWRCERRFAEGWAAWLQRKFTLEAVDFCVTYWLVVDHAPADARFYLNGKLIGEYRAPFKVDVTDFVFLEENTIAIRLTCPEQGEISGVRLQGTPCD
jgi:hypothetical protein